MRLFILFIYLLIYSAPASSSGGAFHHFPTLAHANPHIRSAALKTYARSIVSTMGASGLLFLMKFLYDPEVQVKKQAVESLIDLKPTDIMFQQAVIQALEYNDPEVRIAANWLVDSLLIDHPQVIQNLLKSAEHSNFEVRRSAIHALGRYKITDKKTVEKLNHALSDPHQSVRVAAQWAIKQAQSVLPKKCSDLY